MKIQKINSVTKETPLELASILNKRGCVKLIKDFYIQNDLEIPIVVKLSGTPEEIDELLESVSESELRSMFERVLDNGNQNLIQTFLNKGMNVSIQDMLRLVKGDKEDTLNFLYDINQLRLNDQSDFTKEYEKELVDILLKNRNMNMMKLFIKIGIKMPKVKLSDCRNYENEDSTTLMGIPFENLNKTPEECEVDGIDPDECGINRVVKLPDGNCEDIFTFRDRAESGDRNVGKNPYTMEEIDTATKKQIINQLTLEGITHLEMSDGSKKPVEKLFIVSSDDRRQGNLDDWATLGFFVDTLTNRGVAQRGQGVYNTQNNLIGIVNDWDQGNRSLLDRDNQVILRIPEDVNIYEDYDSDGEIMYKIDRIPGERRVEIRNLTDRESEMYHEQRRREDIARARQLN